MSLSTQLKIGTVAAAALASMIGGAGISAAAPAPAASAHHATPLDVGAPGEGDSSAVAIAPDGTRISGMTALPFGGHRTREGAAPLAALSTQSAIEVDINAWGARLRAWVPNGTVLGLAYPGQTAWGGCQIPGSDGYIWGWLSVLTSKGWKSGWMRHDLWSITQHTYPGGGSDPSRLPWC